MFSIFNRKSLLFKWINITKCDKQKKIKMKSGLQTLETVDPEVS